MAGRKRGGPAKGRRSRARKPARGRPAKEPAAARSRADRSAQRAPAAAIAAHMLELAPAMVTTLDGRILFWGRGLEALYGWPAADAIGASAHRLLQSELPSPRADIRSDLTATGEWRGDIRHRRRDGTWITVSSHWALHRGSRRDPSSVLILDWDVSEVKRVQSMLEEREARLRTVLETAPDAIITIDERGIVQSFSDAAELLFGYAAGEVIGRNISLLMPSPYREQHDGYLDRYRATGERHIIGIGRQVEARRKDGTVFPIELAVGEVKLGSHRFFTGFVRDLTTRVRMEQDLRQAQKMEAVGQLTGGIAHDFNNLLTVILGNLEMLERRLGSDDDRDILKEAREAAQLGADLSKRLLAFGRRQSLAPRLTDINALIRGMVEMLRRTLGRTIEIRTELAEGLPATMVDPGQVENSLLNLGVNARDAMPEGGRLTIETGAVEIPDGPASIYSELAPGRYVRLSVSDSGAGMHPEVRQRAFEPFFTTKGPGAGTGLGLSMVYGFAKQSGGHARIDSELGRGTTVQIYLPARSEPAPAAGRGAAADARSRSGSGEIILVVEDDPLVRGVSIRRLKELGYRVIEAENGPAALAVLRGRKPVDAMFTDVVMAGGLSGFELAQQAKRLRPGLPVLFTSGFAEPAAGKSGVEIDEAIWLAKPYTSEELNRKLRGLLDA